MGFIDYIAEYFRGPAGAPGEPAPVLTRTYHREVVTATKGSAADSEELTFTIPSGGVLVTGGFRRLGVDSELINVNSSEPYPGLNGWSVTYSNLDAAGTGANVSLIAVYYTEE